MRSDVCKASPLPPDRRWTMKSNPCRIVVNPRTPKFQCCLWAPRLAPVDNKIKPWTQRKLDRVLFNIEFGVLGFYLVDVCRVWFFGPSTLCSYININYSTPVITSFEQLTWSNREALLNYQKVSTSSGYIDSPKCLKKRCLLTYVWKSLEHIKTIKQHMGKSVGPLDPFFSIWCGQLPPDPITSPPCHAWVLGETLCRAEGLPQLEANNLGNSLHLSSIAWHTRWCPVRSWFGTPKRTLDMCFLRLGIGVIDQLDLAKYGAPSF